MKRGGPKSGRLSEDTRSVGFSSSLTTRRPFFPLLLPYSLRVGGSRISEMNVLFLDALCAVVMVTCQVILYPVIAGTFRECVANHIRPLPRRPCYELVSLTSRATRRRLRKVRQIARRKTFLGVIGFPIRLFGFYCTFNVSTK